MPKRINSGKGVLKWRIMDLTKLDQIRSNKAITSRLGKIIWVAALEQKLQILRHGLLERFWNGKK